MRIGRKEKRRGGARDESEIYIGYNRDALLQMIIRIEKKYGITFAHDFEYTPAPAESKSSLRLPFLWRTMKKAIRKHLDGWQQELPLF